MRTLRSLLPVRSENGQNSLEVAFVSIVIFFLIAGVVDLGGAYQHYIVALNASREGARMYARLPCTSTNRVALKNAVLDSTIGEAANSNVTLLASKITITPDPSSACPGNGSTVMVTVEDDFEPLMGKFWNSATLPIRASTSMMFYGTD